MSRVVSLPFLIALTLSAACAGDDTSTGERADLVGRWHLDGDAGEVESEYIFTDDGGYVLIDHAASEGDPERVEGTYQVEGASMTLDGTDERGGQHLVELEFFASGSQLMMPAFLPDGVVAGPVGRWTQSLHRMKDGQVELDVKTTYDLRRDGTFTMPLAIGAGADVSTLEGTWSEEAEEILLSFEDDAPERLAYIDGEALGGDLFHRAPVEPVEDP